MVKNDWLKENEKIDALQRNGYSIIQDSTRFCFGMDAVLLTEFAKDRIRKGEKVLDLCTGTGIIPILLKAKTEAGHFTAIEIQDEVADMARRSMQMNGIEDDIEVITGDLCKLNEMFPGNTFDVVTVNPPYMIPGKALINPDSSKAIARHEIKCTLDDVIGQAGRVLKSNGRFIMVHKPERLGEIIAKMREKKIEPKRLQIVYPRVDSEPSMILIEGLKGGNQGMRIEKPLIIYDENGEYKKEISDIYKES